MGKTTYLIALAVLVMASMTGCLRSATTAPEATTTLAFSLPTQNVVSIAQTATALAMVRLTGTPVPTGPGSQATNPFVTPGVSLTKSIATNTPSGPTPTKSRKDYSYDPAPNASYPRISIAWVDADLNVGIRTYGFPSTGTYTISMGVGPRGGTIITTGTGSASSTFAAVYNIPAELKGVSPLYIRVDFSDGTYTYNWFYNITTQ
jgi:hypothetical protein